ECRGRGARRLDRGDLADAQRPRLERPLLPRNTSLPAQRPGADAGKACRMIRLRYADEWVGLLVVLAVVLMVAAALHAAVLSAVFRPAAPLRILLPQEGVAGLSKGANVEVLGTKAGTVRQVVIKPDQQMYAEADIDDQARAFLRRDSHAVIRRQFG